MLAGPPYASAHTSRMLNLENPVLVESPVPCMEVMQEPNFGRLRICGKKSITRTSRRERWSEKDVLKSFISKVLLVTPEV